MEPGCFIASLWLIGCLHPVSAGGFYKSEGPNDVGLYKDLGAFDGVVNMAFRGKVDDASYVVLGEKSFDKAFITDITLNEGIVWHPVAFLKVVEIACIG